MPIFIILNKLNKITDIAEKFFHNLNLSFTNDMFFMLTHPTLLLQVLMKEIIFVNGLMIMKENYLILSIF